MDRLVIHLGLAKAASKSLQQSVFPHFPGFRGDGGTNPGLARSFGRAFLEGERRSFEPTYVRSSLHAWVQAAQIENESQVIISVESLSRWCNPFDDVAAWPVQHSRRARPRRGVHPIVLMLDQLQLVLPDSVSLHTILVLRNQTDWLGSLAAHLGISDTTFIPRLLDKRDAYLDYYSLVTSLEALRGPSQHSTYFLEAGLQNMAQDMAESFAPNQALDPEWAVLNQSPRSNERRVAERQWIVSTANYKPVSRKGAARRAWSKLHEYIPRNVAKMLQAQSTMVASHSSASALTISDEERDAVRRHCHEANTLLSQHLEVDLDPLGY